MWYASAAIYRKNLLLFHEVVSHVLVNETEGGLEKMTQCDIGGVVQNIDLYRLVLHYSNKS